MITFSKPNVLKGGLVPIDAESARVRRIISLQLVGVTKEPQHYAHAEALAFVPRPNLPALIRGKLSLPGARVGGWRDA